MTLRVDRSVRRTSRATTYPEFAAFLVEERIDSVSLNPDAATKTTVTIANAENSAAERGDPVLGNPYGECTRADRQPGDCASAAESRVARR